MIENPQIIGNNHTDQVIDEEYQDNVEQPTEQPVEQQVPQESDEVTLRRSTRVKRSAIPSDYIVYMQESNYNIGAANDPKTFSQATSSKESNL